MATFKTHSEGGSWDGGGHDVRNCNASQQAMINVALAQIQAILNKWDLPCLTGLRNGIQDRLNCSLVLDCPSCNPGLDGQTASRGSSDVSLCNQAFITQQRLTAVLFHEMVHSANGTELDAEAIENHFLTGNGATAPTSGDFTSFIDDEGEFTIWDRATGKVFEKCVEGGSWDSGPTVTKGKVVATFPDPGNVSGSSWV